MSSTIAAWKARIRVLCSENEASWSELLCEILEGHSILETDRTFHINLIQSCLLHSPDTLHEEAFFSLLDPWQHGSWYVLLITTVFIFEKWDACFSVDWLKVFCHYLSVFLSRSNTWLISLQGELASLFSLPLALQTMEFLVTNQLSTLSARLSSKYLQPLVPLLWNEQKFYRRVLSPSIAIFLRENPVSGEWGGWIQGLVAKWVRLGHASAFANAVLLAQTIMGSMWLYSSILNRNDSDRIVFEILDHVHNIYVSSEFESVRPMSGFIQRHLDLGRISDHFVRFIYRDSISIYHKWALLDALFNCLSAPLDLLLLLSRHWADQGAVKVSSFESIRASTLLLLLGYYYSPSNCAQLDSLVMSGVSAHLNASDPNIRHCGMFVAEFHAKRENRELDFGSEFHQTNVYQSLSRFVQQVHGYFNKEQIEADNIVREILPISDDEDVDDVDVLAKEKCGPPRLLRDIVECLKSQDLDRQALGLEGLEEQVRCASDNTLIHAIPSLVQSLLNIDAEEKKRIDALLIIIGKQPEISIPILTREFWSKNVAIEDRVFILSLLARCCQEFSGKCEWESMEEEGSLFLAFKRLSVERSSAKVAGDLFSAKMAHLIFYGLWGKGKGEISIVVSDKDEGLEFGDLVLERMILCLTMVVYYSRASLRSEEMMLDLCRWMLASDMISRGFMARPIGECMLKCIYFLMIRAPTGKAEYVLAVWGPVYAQLERWLEADNWKECGWTGEYRVKLLLLIKERFRELLFGPRPENASHILIEQN